MVDMWDTTPIAQQFPAQGQDGYGDLARVIAEQKSESFESRTFILSSVGRIVADLRAQDAILAAQQATLAAQTATLAAQQATLTAQQASLAAAVANIATLVGQQIDTATGTGASNNFAVSSGEGAYGAVSITVPAGFTQASIQVNGGAAMYYTGATNPEQLNARVVIAASGGTPFAIMVDTSSIGSRITSVAVSHTATFTGLFAGQVITAYLGLRSNSSTWPASGYNTAACSALAVFRR